MKIGEISTMLNTIEYAGETFVKIQELNELLQITPLVEMEEFLITPYYIQDSRRMELYQYEFCCTSDCCFEDYILAQTGKNRIEDIPEEILCLRRSCFATVDEAYKLYEFLKFLLANKDLQEEVVQVFGDYAAENLYAIIY